MAKKTKKVDELLAKFNRDLEKAKDSRNNLLSYLEDKYDIDTRYYAEKLEDECEWCYGIDTTHLEDLIKNA